MDKIRSGSKLRRSEPRRKQRARTLESPSSSSLRIGLILTSRPTLEDRWCRLLLGRYSLEFCHRPLADGFGSCEYNSGPHSRYSLKSDLCPICHRVANTPTVFSVSRRIHWPSSCVEASCEWQSAATVEAAPNINQISQHMED
ncbi:hypothetical protein DTO280E4_3408 [Paecilomyces variotii]|nr:hypothetical protein DTO032I3_438 [Paecilomyces variotii]KAJ9253014.1 hypothetical protein DTO195F2_7251 [Paecilomyces variotii]KAJ9279997.1 hypothetical protein DTO021D3_3225 [Paecilomyces variotii]KAJ9284534.1 hypothetical protein DTO021C3_7869 [Paecilomyces variotii]KAJ9304525.1 hypothetical protein DTO217A2_6015 [Paecilomyces variotii]